jgi:riboflavin synthase
MFTGIVEGTGRVRELTRVGSETRLRVTAPRLPLPRRGASVAVDGVCLTIERGGRGWFEAVVTPETLSRTTLGLLNAGARVNLERPLRAGGSLGGHLVQGHVDGVGVVESVRPEGSGSRMRVRFPHDLDDLIVMKGSIAVDGISLTVALRGEGWFEVALIPETLRVTGASEYAPGSPVNLEVDCLGRYVVEYLKRRAGDGPETPLVTREDLARHGFVGRESSGEQA